MKFYASEGEIADVSYFKPERSSDIRGSFTKIFSNTDPASSVLETAEVFYSDSIKGALRGMHLQINESLNDRLITILSGRVFDVLLDLRKESPTFLKYKAFLLSPNLESTVYVPSGVAHGFQALEESRTLYVSSKIYSPINDSGIDANSFGIDWPIKKYIQSDRDKKLPSLQDWLSKVNP